MNKDNSYCIEYEEGCQPKACKSLCGKCKGIIKINKKSKKDANNSTPSV
jgi:hypothetical protein